MLALFDIPETVWQALIVTVGTIVLAWMQQRTKSAVTETKKEVVAAREESATKEDASQVKETLATVKDVANGNLSDALRQAEELRKENAELKRNVAFAAGKADSLWPQTQEAIAELRKEIEVIKEKVKGDK